MGSSGNFNPIRSTGKQGMNMTGAGDIIPRGFQKGQLGQFTPEQMQLFQSLFSHVQPGSYLSKLAGGSPEAFEQMEAPAMRQFAGLQGQLASRFSGMGGVGGRRSSGFQHVANQAANEFAEQLQSQRQGLQRQALGDLFGMSQMLLGQNPYERFLIEQQQRPSGFAKAMGIGLPIAGGIAGGIFGGPMGAALGSQLGGSLGSAFTGTPHQSSFSGIGKLPTKWG